MPEPHPLIRAFERYGLSLTSWDLDVIMLDVTAAKLRLPSTACMQRINGETEIWFVDVHGARMRVAYRPRIAKVVSVLPLQDKPLKPRKINGQLPHSRRRRERAEHWTEQMED